MAYSIKGTDYYRVTIRLRPEEGYEFLETLTELGINLEAFAAVPLGPDHVQLTLFPKDAARLETESKRAGLTLDGPHPAILVRGDDELGALAKLHRRLADASIAIYSSTGVADGAGSFAYLIYVREDQFADAMKALGTD